MFSELSTFGKLLIVIGYLLAIFLIFLGVFVALACLAQMIDGKSFGSVPFTTSDYIMSVLLPIWLWSSFAALVGLLHLLRVSGSVRRCRVLAGYLCLLIPFGTVFGVLVFVYLGRQSTLQTGTL